MVEEGSRRERRKEASERALFSVLCDEFGPVSICSFRQLTMSRTPVENRSHVEDRGKGEGRRDEEGELTSTIERISRYCFNLTSTTLSPASLTNRAFLFLSALPPLVVAAAGATTIGSKPLSFSRYACVTPSIPS